MSKDWRAIREALERLRAEDEIISVFSPSVLARGRWWPEEMTFPTGLLGGLLEPRKGYQFRPENVVLPRLLMQRRGDPKTVVDLGSGSGSLLLGALHSLHGITRAVGVEQQPAMADRCRRTLSAHGFDDVARVVVGDLRELSVQAEARAWIGDEGASLIVTNPPFFPSGWGLPSQHESARLSTHAEHGSVEDFLITARALLAPEGAVWVVFDAQRLAELLTAAAACGLYMERFAWIPDQREGKQQQPFRVWVELAARAPNVERIPTDAHTTPWDARSKSPF